MLQNFTPGPYVYSHTPSVNKHFLFAYNVPTHHKH